MRSIYDYILEKRQNDDFYGTLLYKIDLDLSKNKKEMKTFLNKEFEEMFNKFLIVRISAIEEYNKKGQEDHNKRKKEYLEKEEKRIIKLMQSKPGILKRKPESQQKWIKQKLDDEEYYFDNSWKTKFTPIQIKDIDSENVEFGWHYDIYSDHAYRIVSNWESRKYVIEDIIEHMYSGREWDHILSLNIFCKSFVDNYVKFNIFPLFDDETEDNLEKGIRRFQNFMRSEYESGRYMGD